MSRENYSTNPSYYLGFRKSNVGRIIVNLMLILICIFITIQLYPDINMILYVLTISLIVSLILFKMFNVSLNDKEFRELADANLISKSNISVYFIWLAFLYIFTGTIVLLFL